MERSKFSRDFSSRVEVNFHRHANVFRRWMWLISLACGVLGAGWLVWNAKYGRPEIYNGGGLSESHRMFENRCEVCHRPWSGPIERLASLGQSEHAISAADEQCLACHAGPGHFFVGGSSLKWEEKATAAQLTTKHFQACASCHREHQGADELREIAGASCVGCHSDLRTASVEAAQLESLTFQVGGTVSIQDFASHPEFGVHVLQAEGGSVSAEAVVKSADGVELPPAHGARSVLEKFRRLGEPEEKWQDRGRLRFNHGLHLREAGVVDSRGETHVLRDNCGRCHEPDSQRRLMLPIRYENHCSSCHPLVFDPGLVRDRSGATYSLEWSELGGGEGRIRSRLDSEKTWGMEELLGKDGRFELLTAPHREPVEVRGYLTDVYAAGVLRGVIGDGVEGDSDAAVVQRPGRLDSVQSPQIAQAAQQRISAQVAAAEQLLQAANFPRGTGEEIPGLFRSLRWLQGSGGCRFCHETDDGEVAGAGVGQDDELYAAGAWPLPAIRRPRLPDRWYVHSEFDHDSHRMMGCVDCHSGGDVGGGGGGAGKGVPNIFASRSTGDVLMPRLDVCLKCHSERPDAGGRLASAGADCLTCHVYHQREFETGRRRSIEEILRGTSREVGE
jgi:hypothetical protein